MSTLREVLSLLDAALGPGNPRSIGNTATLATPMGVDDFAVHIEKMLDRALQGYSEKAIALGLDAYLSGEISEPTVHAARNGGIHYFGCGRHETERYEKRNKKAGIRRLFCCCVPLRTRTSRAVGRRPRRSGLPPSQ